jgi:hypothetical protein
MKYWVQDMVDRIEIYNVLSIQYKNLAMKIFSVERRRIPSKLGDLFSSLFNGCQEFQAL